MQLWEIEEPILNSFQEKLRDGAEMITNSPVLPHTLLCFQPNVLGRILFWGVWHENKACHQPFIGLQSLIDFCQIFDHFFPFVIRCSIPQKEKSFFEIFLPKILHKLNRMLPISSAIRTNRNLTLCIFNCAIIGLSLTEIGHQNLNSFRSFAPYIATGIIPDQMAFIQIQHDQFMLVVHDGARSVSGSRVERRDQIRRVPSEPE